MGAGKTGNWQLINDHWIIIDQPKNLNVVFVHVCCLCLHDVVWSSAVFVRQGEPAGLATDRFRLGSAFSAAAAALR